MQRRCVEEREKSREAKVPARVAARCHSRFIGVAWNWLKSAGLGAAGILQVH